MTRRPDNQVVGDLIHQQTPPGTLLRFRVVSDSMAPVIRRGDWVTVRRVEVGRLRRGDVVVHTHAGAFRVHRLLSVRRRGDTALLVTKGDGKLQPDPPWSGQALLGRVAAIDRDDRRIELETPAWRATNRLLGALSRVEVVAFRLGSRAKRAVLGQRKTMTILAHVGTRLIQAPSRFCSWLANRRP